MSADRCRGDGLFAAIDIGGTSVRSTIARCSATSIEIIDTVRIPTPYVSDSQGIRFDAVSAYTKATTALHDYRDNLLSVAIDSWSADYAIERLDGSVDLPISQRQARTSRVISTVDRVAPQHDVFMRAGVRLLPLHTIYQLVADRAAGRLENARSVLLIPDLFVHWLTGRRTAEYTNASSTGLTMLSTRDWDSILVSRLGLAAEIFPSMVHAGDVIGTALPAAGIGSALITAAASHDTASATVALPTADDEPLYISCGSWALVGTTTAAPVLSKEAYEAGFTNEAGIDGVNRFLRVCAGLGLLNECLRSWGMSTDTADPGFIALLRQAEAAPRSPRLFRAEDITLMQSSDLPAHLLEAAQLPKADLTPAVIVRLILDSLAASLARQIELLCHVLKRPPGDVHLVGGGSAIDLLCRMVAEATGRTVWAGPTEATTVGNLLIQARSAGILTADAQELRALARRWFPPRRFDPQPAVRNRGGAAGPQKRP